MLDIHLHKTFQSKQRKTTVFCNAQFEQGITTAIYGRSGVGKSTVLRIISGLETADKGHIRLNDDVWFDSQQRINIPIVARNIGFVFQDFNLFPNMTVEQNLKYASSGSIAPEIMQLLDSTGLMNLFKSYPSALSGGERQRVSIIRSLCQKPEILLMDEPFSALDDDSIEQLIHEIRLIQQKLGTTVIVISHRKDIIFRMATSVVHMIDASTVVQGTPSELFSESYGLLTTK